MRTFNCIPWFAIAGAVASGCAAKDPAPISSPESQQPVNFPGLVLDVDGARPFEQRTAVPAYWSPRGRAGMGLMQQLAQSAPTNGIVVLNANSKAPPADDSAYLEAIQRIHAGGALVFGYVDTGYYGHGTGDTRGKEAWTAQILGDVEDWYTRYPAIDGIFLDETPSSCDVEPGDNQLASWYIDLRGLIRYEAPNAKVIINPGQAVNDCYKDAADIIITFEGTCKRYENSSRKEQTDFDWYGARDWQLASDTPTKFWNLIYDVPEQGTAACNWTTQEVVKESRKRNVGYVYVTNDTIDSPTDSPWDTLPPYWASELLTVADSPDQAPPSKPEKLSAVAIAGTSDVRVSLNWQASRDDLAVREYHVVAQERGKTPAAPAISYGTALIIPGFSRGTTYTFQVQAFDAAGNAGPWSDTVEVATPSNWSNEAVLTPTVCFENGKVTFSAAYADPFDYHRVFIDRDHEAATGSQVWVGSALGADYMIENGGFWRSTGAGWNWGSTEVAPFVSDTNDVFVWSVPVSELGPVEGDGWLVAFRGSDSSTPSEVLNVTSDSGCTSAPVR